MYRAGAIAERLGIAPTTVRSWSTEFQAYLSPSAGRHAGAGQRRYTDGDLATLGHVKRLLGGGLTFQETRHALEGMTPEERAAPPVLTARPSATSTPPGPGEASAALVVGDLLRAVAEAHAGEVQALRDALAQAVARADRAERDLDELRAQLAPPALPPPETLETPALSPADAPPVAASPSLSWWETVKRWFNPPEAP